MGRPTSKPLSWESLMQRAIQLAQQKKDPRLGVLQLGSQQGKAQATLKRLGIIGEADLTREFPT